LIFKRKVIYTFLELISAAEEYEFRMCMIDFFSHTVLQRSAWNHIPLHHTVSVRTKTTLPVLILYSTYTRAHFWTASVV
jgi:hypothetical protein